MATRHRERYPNNWEELSVSYRASVYWRCEQCGIYHREWRVGKNRVYQENIQAAHLDHDPENPNPRLMAMCQPCHLRYDALENGKKSYQARIRKQYEAEIEAGQMELFIDDTLEGRETA
jgi:hypothetical protein